jgi:hypothetical protein
MAQLIAETAGKLNMTIVTNVDTVTVFLRHDTTSRTTKAIASLSGRVNVKVMKRPAERTKMSTTTPARPVLEPIEQREATYNKVRKRIFALRPSDPDKASGAGLMTNPWGILVETPEQTGMDFQSVVDAVLSRSDTTNEDDVSRPIITKTGLAPISKAHSNKLRRKRRFTQRQLYQLWLQEIQHVMVWMPESHAENVTDKTTAIGNIKNLEEAVVSSNNRNRTIDDNPMCGSHLPEMSDANLGELPEISCTQSRALTSARSGRSLKSEQKRAARDQAGGHQWQTRQHAENTLALAERTQHSHTADVLETISLCTTVVTTFSTDKIALINILHAVNAACCLWRSMMLLTWCYQQQGNADGNNAQSRSSQRDNTETTSATNVWTTSLPLRPTNQMDMDQVSITSGQSVTTAADPDEIQAQMALLVLESLANSSSTQWMQAKLSYNQDRPQFDQVPQHPDMLCVVVSGMVQTYVQILLSTQADDNTGQPLPPAECQLTHDGQARVTVIFWAELQWQDQAVTLDEIIDSLPGDNTYMFMGSRPARWMSNPSDTDHDTAPGRQ